MNEFAPMDSRVGMTDDDLLNQVETLERQAIGYFSGEVAAEQAQAMDYYLRKPFGTEEEGRSQAISSDVWDVVEGMTPAVLRPFVASEEVVTFRAQGPEDEEAAEQESEYINFVVTQKNDVFEQLVTWVKTGLLQKNGVVKYWWDDTKQTRIERVADVEDDVFAAIIAEPSVEVVEHTEKQAAGPDGMPVVMHDAVLRISNEDGQPCYEAVPPEEFLVGRDTRSLNLAKSRFVQHRRKVTISQLREMGYDVADDVQDDYESDLLSPVRQARQLSEEDTSFGYETNDPSTREVMYRETYIRTDFDGDGLAELRKVCSVGRTVLVNEEAEEIPFAAWTPYQQPFKFYGKCPADEAIEIQVLKSTALRQTMDNLYTINNNRTYAGRGVNLDDLLDNQIAGVVRVDSDNVGNAVRSAEIQPIGQVTLPLIEYFDGAKENRTGWTRYNQGSADLGNQKTLGEVQLVTEMANGRVELISRSFAETGLRVLMLGIHRLCRRHSTRADVVRLRGKWTPVDPRSWKTRYDMSIEVGLGNADKRMKLQGAQMIMAEQKLLAQVPGLVSPQNFYAGAAKLTEAAGYRNVDQFFTDPQKVPPQQPPDPTQSPEFMVKMQELELKKGELGIKQGELQLKAREQDRADAEAKFQQDQAQISNLKDMATMQGGMADRQEDNEREERMSKDEESAMQAVMAALAELKAQVQQIQKAVAGG